MNRFDELLGTNDIDSIDYKESGYSENYDTLDINFAWEMDCGCFSFNRYSHLILRFPNELLNKVVDNMTNIKGKIGAYILNHKEYSGILLEIKGDDLVD